jgi:MtaA/CmuA family methyltransferase
MTYSAMERFNDALNGETRDRVPFFPMIAGWAAANFSDSSPSKVALEPKLIVDAQVRALEAMGYDALYAYADPLYIPEAFGCRVRFLETGPLVDPLPLTIDSLKDLDKLSLPAPREEGRLPVILEAVHGLSSYGGGDIPVLGLFEGPFTTTCRIIETEFILRMIYKNRQILEFLLDKVNGFLLGFGHALVENGANIIFIPEPSASASMISPSMFRQFVLPRLQTLTGHLNVPCILHMCGNTSPVLDAMWETGAKVLSLDQCMSWGPRSRS